MAARTEATPLELGVENQSDDGAEMVSCVTVTIEKRTVFQTAFHQVGSARRPDQMTQAALQNRQLR